MINFTVEEVNLICIYNEGSRQRVVANLTTALPFMEEAISSIAKQALRKLRNMSDREFLQFSFIAAEI